MCVYIYSIHIYVCIVYIYTHYIYCLYGSGLELIKNELE